MVNKELMMKLRVLWHVRNRWSSSNQVRGRVVMAGQVRSRKTGRFLEYEPSQVLSLPRSCPSVYVAPSFRGFFCIRDPLLEKIIRKSS